MHILSYLAVACLIGVVGGFSFRLFVRNLKWDRKHKFFRFKNHWHYLFSGELLDFPHIPGVPEEVDLKYLDVLVDTDEGSILYSGYLSEYNLNTNGGIDSIYLTKAKRRFLKQDGEENCHYEMPGEFFVIPFQQIKNLHITYYSVEPIRDQLRKELEVTETPE
jgi:hypothetical protein